jgi:hypothetical protein
MKKYIIPAAAMLLFAGVAGAQTTKPQPSQTTPAKKEVVARKAAAADKSTASVSGSGKASGDSKATAVTRKHHHNKKTKPSTKTEGK